MEKDYDEADNILNKIEKNKKLSHKEKMLLRDYLLDTYPSFATNIRNNKRLRDVS